MTAVSALLYIISDEKHKRKIFSKKREKERKERNAHLLGLKTLNKKNRQKSLWTKMHRRNKKRPISIKRERER